MSATILRTLADNTDYLNERVSKAEVEKTGKSLKVIHVILIDPTTGQPLGASDFFPPTYKELAFTQAGAVQNTWYTAFSGSNVEFAALGIGITVADETVEVRITLDGVAVDVAAGVALAFAGNKFTSCLATPLAITSGAAILTLGAAAATLVAPSVNPHTWIKGRTIMIQARKTTAGGASALQVFGVYY